MADEVNVKLEVVMSPIGSIHPYENNPRENSVAIYQVAESIRAYGFQQPIVVDVNNVIVAGHTRYLAAKELGLKTVPVVVAKHLTEAQIKAYRIADNKTHDFSTWDHELLKFEFEGIEEMFTGFSEAEILELCDSEGVEFDPNKEWTGMPEFNQPDGSFYRSLKINFEDEDGLKKFLEVTNIEITDKTISLIYPVRSREVRKDKAYIESE